MKRQKILVIEDDRNTNLLISDNLQSAGYEVTSVFDGEQGIQTALRDTPDLIMLDLLLPRMDGWEVCRRLRVGASAGRLIPIIIVSIVDKKTKFKDAAMGSVSFVNKPFEIKNLLGEVKKVLKNAQS